jgi:dTDP-4-dehydrorhamnose 3,5-epimerase
MELIKTPFDGLYVLQTVNFTDNRGGFQKLFNEEFFRENGLECEFKEIYYSVNKKDVIRGMHFQTPPCDHVKMVHVSKGRILDVVVDIRKNTETFGKCFSIELNDQNGQYLYIPKGFAHGFKTIEDGSIVNYAQTSCYNNEHDCGVDAMSVGFDWEIENPIRSGRDLSFEKLSEFNSPF